jgi:hypothetical protein
MNENEKEHKMNENELEALVVRAAKKHGYLVVVKAHVEAAERGHDTTLYGILDAGNATLTGMHKWQEDIPDAEWQELVGAIDAAFRTGDVLTSMNALVELAEEEAGDREAWLVLNTAYLALSLGLVG